MKDYFSIIDELCSKIVGKLNTSKETCESLIE